MPARFLGVQTEPITSQIM